METERAGTKLNEWVRAHARKSSSAPRIPPRRSKSTSMNHHHHIHHQAGVTFRIFTTNGFRSLTTFFAREWRHDELKSSSSSPGIPTILRSHIDAASRQTGAPEGRVRTEVDASSLVFRRHKPNAAGSTDSHHKGIAEAGEDTAFEGHIPSRQLCLRPPQTRLTWSGVRSCYSPTHCTSVARHYSGPDLADGLQRRPAALMFPEIAEKPRNRWKRSGRDDRESGRSCR